jgi:hypothetical protein
MPWYARINGSSRIYHASPFSAHGMHIGMANAAIEDFELDINSHEVHALESVRHESSVAGVDRIAMGSCLYVACHL